jgi:alkylation response protein AidB-like acyl-CoA dehydrogenase
MAIGITDEHVELQRAARRWTEQHCGPAVARGYLDVAEEPARPPFWDALRATGWLGLALPESCGGEGYGLPELVVILEELGRAGAPGPFVPTVLAALTLAAGGAPPATVNALISGEHTGAVSLEPGAPLLGSAHADVFVLAGAGGRWSWYERDAVDVAPLASLDATRRTATATPTGAGTPLAGADVRTLAAVVVSAECVGGAQWCVDTAASYAKVREQFGRPIGQFQAVKHRCAEMLVITEQARAAVWDAARGADDPAEAQLCASVAAALTLDAFTRVAKDCVQVLGGIGFTWEHDAHLYLKRAMAIRQLLGGSSHWRIDTANLARAGTRHALALDLPAGAEHIRDEARTFAEQMKAIDDRDERRRAMADAGYLAPHWPRPWGRDASAVEQIVIDEEFRRARVQRPNLSIGAWALPTIIAHGSPEQQERFVRPSLYGELNWCQMFSEPGAGSDLASLTTKASRVEGGWLLSGQKVWTSMARDADWAICLARTDPDLPKHAGITYFLVDMRSEGLDVRPLRELTGAAMFNEVFLSDVFVPDECVVGAVNDGWRFARTTLANERVSMGSGSSFGAGVEALLQLPAVTGADHDERILDVVGGLLAEAQSLSILGFRVTLRALSGADPGPESSVRKLLGVEHDQRVQEVGLELLGPAGAALEGDAFSWGMAFLANRCLTIAGGTSEVQRNVIAERLLGLPRDP